MSPVVAKAMVFVWESRLRTARRLCRRLMACDSRELVANGEWRMDVCWLELAEMWRGKGVARGCKHVDLWVRCGRAEAVIVEWKPPGGFGGQCDFCSICACRGLKRVLKERMRSVGRDRGKGVKGT